MNVFHLDCSFIDQYADRERQTAERHDIDTLARRPEQDHRT